MITDTLRLKDVTVNDITTGFKLGDSLANTLKWYLIGLYIQGDKVAIKELESLFTSKGSLHDKRAYKTEAKAVYNELISEKSEFEIINPNTNKAFTIAELGDMKAENINSSVGVLYKAIDKGFNPKTVAKQAIDNPNINTAGIKTPSKLLEIKDNEDGFYQADIQEMAKQAFDAQEQVMTDRKGKNSKPKSNTPALTVDKVKQFMADLQINNPAEFDELSNYILDLAVTQEPLGQAA